MPVASMYVASSNQLDPAVLQIGGTATIMPLAPPDTITAGTWASVWNSAYMLGFFTYNTSAANGDQAGWKVYLVKGTYTLETIHYRDAAAGIVDVYLDTTQIGTFDGTAGSGNVSTQTTSISVAANGLYTISLKVDGTGGGGDYTCRICAINLRRTA